MEVSKSHNKIFRKRQSDKSVKAKMQMDNMEKMTKKDQKKRFISSMLFGGV